MTATNDLLKRIAFAVLGVSLIAYGLWLQSGEPNVATGARSASNNASATTAQPPLVKIPIKDMRVGTRVPAFNPEVSATERSAFREPNWYQWMKLKLEMPKPDGTMLEIEMLRSEEWLIQQMALVVQPESIMLPAYSEAERTADKASEVSEPSSLGSPAIATANDTTANETTANETTATKTPAPETTDTEARSSEYSGIPLRPIYFHLAELLSEAAAGGDEVLGLVVQLDLPELGLSGPAWIVDLEPAPIIPSGPGQVVTATFKHASANVLDLILTSTQPTTQTTSLSTQPPSPSVVRSSPSTLNASPSSLSDNPSDITDSIGVTANHPFWSVDRAEFVQAGELKIGERLQTLAGDTVWVQQKLPRPGPEPVYNLEVHDEHVYYVGCNAILAHNSYPKPYGTPYAQLTKARLRVLEAKVANRTITRAEWKHLQWHKRLKKRRQDGIDAFWANERQLISQGLQGTRNWNEAAKAAILGDGQPRGIFSHHMYSVSKYPQLANDPSNILPVTFFEHFRKWHNGSWYNSTHGVPLRIDIPDSF